VTTVVGCWKQPGVAAHVGDARGFVSASNRHYDLIQLSLAGSAGAGGGLGGLNEDYLDTVEAFQALSCAPRAGRLALDHTLGTSAAA